MEIEPFSLPAEYMVQPNKHPHHVTVRSEKGKVPSVWDNAVAACSISTFRPAGYPDNYTAQDQCMTPTKFNCAT
jgi:hypothetical protein